MANHLTLEEREIIAHMQRAEVRRYVGERLRQRWSPDQIAGRSRNDFPHDQRRQVSPPTIYAWIHAEEARGKRWHRYLRRLGRKRPVSEFLPLLGQNQVCHREGA